MKNQQKAKSKTENIEKKRRTQTIAAVVGIFLLIILVTPEQNPAPTSSPSPEATAEPTPTPTPKPKYYEALRWCQVMEARDLYLYTYDSKTPLYPNLFDEAYKSCESDLKSWGSDKFIEVIAEDWNGEYGKDSTVEGKTLQEYADDLAK